MVRVSITSSSTKEGSILAVLASLSGIGCLLLRSDSFSDGWDIIFGLFGCRGFSEGSGLVVLQSISFIVGQLGILAFESSSEFVLELVSSICAEIRSIIGPTQAIPYSTSYAWPTRGRYDNRRFS